MRAGNVGFDPSTSQLQKLKSCPIPHPPELWPSQLVASINYNPFTVFWPSRNLLFSSSLSHRVVTRSVIQISSHTFLTTPLEQIVSMKRKVLCVLSFINTPIRQNLDRYARSTFDDRYSRWYILFWYTPSFCWKTEIIPCLQRSKLSDFARWKSQPSSLASLPSPPVESFWGISTFMFAGKAYLQTTLSWSFFLRFVTSSTST